MSKVFTARFDITGAGPIGTGGLSFEVFGDVIDPSLAGYSVSDVQVGNVFFDENSITGDHNRYTVTSIVATGRLAFQGATVNSIHLHCVWSDQGVVDSNGPEGGSGLIGAASSNSGLAEIPAFTIYGISEALHTRVININNRLSVDPFIGDGTRYQKNMVNGYTSTIAAGTPVAKVANGTVVPSDAQTSPAHPYIGITAAAIAVGAKGPVLLIGQNIAGALTGKGFAIGDSVYVSEGGGYTNNPASITDPRDAAIRVGFADCGDGIASSTVTDLVMQPQILIRP